MAYNREGYFQRARAIRELTDKYYEPGRQDRCYHVVWRREIYPRYGICYKSYLKYLKADRERRQEQIKQPTFFDDL